MGKRRATRGKRAVVTLTAAACLVSGLVNLWSLVGSRLPEYRGHLRMPLPLDFVHLSRFAVLLIGFALIVSSIHLYRRKRRALHFVLVLSSLSIVFHLTKGLNYEEAALSAVLLFLLLLARKQFLVGSSAPNLRRAVAQMVLAFAVALLYGVAGFWLLDRRDFGIDFSLADSIHRTLLYLSLVKDPGILPRTRYAAWFEDSLYLMTVVATGYGLVALFRPVLYTYRTLPQERMLARKLVAESGRSSLDYFKYWKDKSFFFSPTRRCFLAYRVGGGYALVLGDPVGPEAEMEATIRGFENVCEPNDWSVAFHQTLPDFLPIYRRLGYRKLQIGEEGIVDLESFSLEGSSFRKMRNTVNKLERGGVRFLRYAPPLRDAVLEQAKEVSDGWLQLPGRRERTFTLGLFEPDYVGATPLDAAVDAAGRMLGFVNEIPSFRPGEATVDLMRHRPDSPPGVMDYIFLKLFLALQEAGYARFSMGLAPMSGLRPEEASPEERAVHYFVRRLNFLFSYRGLRYFKAKFATSWEPRYLVYKNVLNLPRVARAITEVTEVH